MGDWDRHSGQWRWGREGNRWKAIPEDRDWAFARMDGFVGGLARLFVPKYVGFSEQFPAIGRLTEQADRLDHRILNRLDQDSFLAVAREVQSSLSDSVINAAVAALPSTILELEQQRLVSALKARRDELVEYAAVYYRHLTKQLRVFGFRNSADVVEFDRVSDSGARVRLRAGGPSGPITFERFVRAQDTKELELHIETAKDVIRLVEGLPFKVSIAAPEKAEDSDD